MLVLSRAQDERIMIGDDIEIVVLDFTRDVHGAPGGGRKVRLGIIAPAHVPVHPKEVYDAIKREGRRNPR